MCADICPCIFLFFFIGIKTRAPQLCIITPPARSPPHPFSSTSSHNITVSALCSMPRAHVLCFNVRGGWRRCNNTPRLRPLFSPHKPSKHTFAASSLGQNISALNAMCGSIHLYETTPSEEKSTCTLSSSHANHQKHTVAASSLGLRVLVLRFHISQTELESTQMYKKV